MVNIARAILGAALAIDPPIVRNLWLRCWSSCGPLRRWSLPSAVLGPVESPPWKRQRLLPGSTLTKQGTPFRVRAPQQGRSFSRSGEPSPASPSSARRLHLPPIPQAESEQVRWPFAGQTIQPCRCQWFQFSLVTHGLATAASMAARRALCRSFPSIRASP
jgi:hypothetical protein